MLHGCYRDFVEFLISSSVKNLLKSGHSRREGVDVCL